MSKAMKNKDLTKEERMEILQRMSSAIAENNTEDYESAFNDLAESIQKAVLEEHETFIESNNANILAQRGVRQLTTQETKYYNKVIEAWKSSSPQQALTLIDEALPTTVIDSIFEELRERHELLDVINFKNTGILTEILITTQDGRHLATWGKLCDEIVKELTAGTEVIKLNQNKLSAFIPICKAMLEIGPAWIDRYVREILAEAIANGLENAILNGTGVDEPIGMTKDPAGAFNQTTGYPDLTPETLVEITPEAYGTLIADFATTKNGLTRDVGEVIFVCNPVDYYKIVMPAVMFQQSDGTWVSRFPFPTRVIRSAYVDKGKAVMGLGRRYFFGLGNSKGGKIEYSDHYKFLEDERYYLTKLYGDGKPLDNTSFKVLDISGLKPTPIKVIDVTPDPEA